MATNVKQAYAMINGQKVVATYDETTELWTVETTAPSESSWSQPGHVYEVTLHAEDAAGNTVEMDSSDETYGSRLKIRVLEKTKPVATIISPTQNAVLGSATQDIVMEIYDIGGSGLNMSSVSFTFNDVAYTGTINWADTDDGKKRATVTMDNLADGVNKETLSVSDNDGNTSDLASVQFVISTAAPLLSVTTPTDELITNSPTLVVSGTASAGSDLTTLSSVTVNGESATLTEGDDGVSNFTATVTLTSGANSIVVVATDSIGKTTSITRTVTLDTEAPVITNVIASATTVDANGVIKITFKVTDQ